MIAIVSFLHFQQPKKYLPLNRILFGPYLIKMMLVVLKKCCKYVHPDVVAVTPDVRL